MSDNFDRFNSWKILRHGDRLEEIAAGGMPFPVDWHVYPSNICNHSCGWCMFRQNGEQFVNHVLMPEHILMKAVDDAARTGAVLMHFSGGGEPLVNKRTPDAMRRAVAAGLKVALSTNGALLTPEVAATVDYLRISLNAGTPEQHFKTNHGGEGTADWPRILENVRAAVPHKKGDIGLAFVVDHYNYNDIIPFCGVAADLGVDFVQIRPAFWYDKAEDAATRAIMPTVYEMGLEAKRLYGHAVDIFALGEKFDGFWTPRSYDKCRAVISGTCLTATGDFAVCQDRTDLRFGAEYAHSATFEDVWLSDEHRRLVDTITAGEGGELDKCPRCVWNRRNEIIQHMFVDDNTRLALV